MMPKTHFLLGALFAPILYFIFHAGIVNSLIVLFASVLIDIDHYLFYAIGKNDWKPKNAFNFFLHLRKRFEALPKHERKKYHTGFFPLHSIEFLAISIFSCFGKYPKKNEFNVAVPRVFVSKIFLMPNKF